MKVFYVVRYDHASVKTEFMARKEYSEDQKTALVALAQEIGIGRAIRELGYPSYPAALSWCKQRGVEPNVDTLMAEMKRFHTFYETTDALLVVEAALDRVRQKLQEDNLDPDELKKTTEALQKSVNTWLVLQGKANNITESQTKDALDLGLFDLLNDHKKKEARESTEARSLTEGE